MKRIIYSICILFICLSCGEDNKDSIGSLSINVKNAPILALKDINTVASITVLSEIDDKNIIKEFIIKTEASISLEDIKSISIFKDGDLIARRNFSCKRKKQSFSIACNEELPKGESIFELGIETKDAVNLDNKIKIDEVRLITEKGDLLCQLSDNIELRMGVALRQKGQDGVDNCRIPGLAITKAGSLIAIYDARYDMNRDLQGNIDIAYNRSTDGGVTWSDMQVAIDMGEWGGLPQKFNGVSDPCILVDDNSDNIYISACWMHGVIDEKTGKWIEGLNSESTEWNHQWRTNGSLPGYDVKQSSQWMLVKSSDDGITWSEARNLTKEVKPESYGLLINAPGAGITLKDGTLVFPAQGRREDGSNFSTLITSKDRGESWEAGQAVFDDYSIHSNECMAVQLSDGSIMLNMRSSKNRGNHVENGRLVATTDDLGQTWSIHPTSGNTLTEPTCQGSILKHIYKDKNGNDQELLLFFNPNDPDKRMHFTMKCSFDEGLTWPKSNWLEVDEGQGSGYSCMVSLDNDTIGVLYEGSGACLVFQRIKIAEIINTK